MRIRTDDIVWQLSTALVIAALTIMALLYADSKFRKFAESQDVRIMRGVE